jgi:hypothetical protein
MILSLYLSTFLISMLCIIATAPPLKYSDLSEGEQKAFTMNSTIELYHFYMDDTTIVSHSNHQAMIDNDDYGEWGGYTYSKHALQALKEKTITQSPHFAALTTNCLSISEDDSMASISQQYWPQCSLYYFSSKINRIRHQRVAIIGTQVPALEVLLIEMGVMEIVTFEFMPLYVDYGDDDNNNNNNSKRRRVISGKRYSELLACWRQENQLAHKMPRMSQTVEGRAVGRDAYEDKKKHPCHSTGILELLSSLHNHFDVVVAMSTVDHSGLGRYGEPVDSEGDLETMEWIDYLLKEKLQRCEVTERGKDNQEDGEDRDGNDDKPQKKEEKKKKKKMLLEEEEGGTVLLSLPIGQDAVVYNLQRIYGRQRLPYLLQRWCPAVHRPGRDEEATKNMAFSWHQWLSTGAASDGNGGVSILGWSWRQLDQKSKMHRYEPIFMLQRCSTEYL